MRIKILLLGVLGIISVQLNAQGYLGQGKDSVKQAFHDCTALDDYPEMLVLSCSGLRSVFYFNGPNKACDMYATDIAPPNATIILNQLLSQGFKLSETKYVTPFLVSKHPVKEKFPAHVYSNGAMEYCFMPVSLSGKTAELNSIVIMYSKKKL